MLRRTILLMCLPLVCGCALTGTKTGTVQAERPSASDDLLQEVRSNTTELGTLRTTIDKVETTVAAKVADKVTADVVAKLQAEVNGLKATISTNKTVTGITGTHLTIGWCAYLVVSKVVDSLLRRAATRKGA